MPLKELTFQNLGELDEGLAGGIANIEIRKALSDLEDRGHDGKVRKVIFELELFKAKGEKVAAILSSQAKLPPRRTNETMAHTKETEGELRLMFRSDNAQNDEQPTFNDITGES